MIDMKAIKELSAVGAIRVTKHVLMRFFQRNIDLAGVECAIAGGEIIEQYPDDTPFPSCLVLGFTFEGKPLHVVCSIGRDELHLITAYHPDADRWENDFKTRKERL